METEKINQRVDAYLDGASSARFALVIFPSYTCSARTFAVPGALQMPFGIQDTLKIVTYNTQFRRFPSGHECTQDPVVPIDCSR